jgi:phage-related protein
MRTSSGPWTIEFQDRRVARDSAALPAGIQAKFLHVSELLIEFGPEIGMPFVRRLEADLYEIRVRGKEGHGRFLFSACRGKRLVILHAFVKKTRRTPLRELAIARQRLRRLKS